VTQTGWATPETVQGVEDAVEQYGSPVEQIVLHRINEDSYYYWQLTTRKRPGEVIMLLRRKNGKYLLHTKAFYPPGVYRLLSGGIKHGEDLVQALQRETYEETGLDCRIDRFMAIIGHRFCWHDREIPFVSYLFALHEKSGTLQPMDTGEEITDFGEVPLEGLPRIADELESLPPNWIDWGRFRAPAHRLAYRLLTSQES
jgi:8-oxo-dGTP pyrophosphatase MutT (NUDIX family)